jgi:hypothetical protein
MQNRPTVHRQQNRRTFDYHNLEQHVSDDMAQPAQKDDRPILERTRIVVSWMKTVLEEGDIPQLDQLDQARTWICDFKRLCRLVNIVRHPRHLPPIYLMKGEGRDVKLINAKRIIGGASSCIHDGTQPDKVLQPIVDSVLNCSEDNFGILITFLFELKAAADQYKETLAYEAKDVH